jgi:hypothetical protein
MSRKSERLKLKKQRKLERKRKAAVNKIISSPDVIEKRNQNSEKIRKEKVNTRAFRTPVSLGPASEVRKIDTSLFKLKED